MDTKFRFKFGVWGVILLQVGGLRGFLYAFWFKKYRRAASDHFPDSEGGLHRCEAGCETVLDDPGDPTTPHRVLPSTLAAAAPALAAV